MTYPRIAPVEGIEPRPLWSVMIPTYGRSPYLEETLEGVLRQDPGPQSMQIEVVDDGSPLDADLAARVHKLGRGRVAFYRRERNGGHVRNFNTCIARARGQVIHILHSDDKVLDGFYARMAVPFETDVVGMAFCRHIFIDPGGVWQGLAAVLQSDPGVLTSALELIARTQPIQTPAVVVRRNTYEAVGGFDPRFRHLGEDWQMWVRIAAHAPVWYDPTPLCMYRTHSDSLSRRVLQAGGGLEELRLAVRSYRAFLPDSLQRSVADDVMRHVATWTLSMAQDRLRCGDLAGALLMAREALRSSATQEVLWRAAVLTLHAGRRYLMRQEGRE
jgi:glycosyltransferase involved in cell wall biosynthesis